MRFKIVDEGGVLPTRGSDGSAGLDLYNPFPEPTIIWPSSRANFPLGIASQFPKGYVALIQDRSSMGKKGIKVLGGVIDSDYRGEWSVILANTGGNIVEIQPGDRIAQVLFIPVCMDPPMLVDDLDDTLRGSGGFGSTGQ